MIRAIGDDQYALYTLAMSVVSLFLLDFGIGAAVTKFLANYHARGQYGEASRFMGVVYKVFLLISCGIALCLGVFWFFIDAVYGKLTPVEVAVFKNLYLIVAAYSVLSFPFTSFNGILMANERFIEVKACNFGQKVFSVVCIVVLLLLGGNVYALVCVHAVSNVVFLALKYFFIRKNTRQKADLRGWDSGIAKSLFGFSAWVTVMSIARRCIFNIMPSLIAAMVGSAMVTLFSLAATLEGCVYSLADAVNGMFMPRISRIFAGERAGEELSALMCRVGRFHVCTIGLFYIGFVCVGRQFVTLWMGIGYESVYLCALLLIFPSLIDVPQQVAKSALTVNDVVKEQGLIYVGMAAINLVLAWLLLPRFGVIGGAVSVCTAYLVRTAALNVLYRKKLRLDLKCYFRKVYGRWSGAAAVTLPAGLLIGRFPLNGWTGLLAKACLIAGVYVVALYVITLNHEEKSLLRSKLPFLKKKGE